MASDIPIINLEPYLIKRDERCLSELTRAVRDVGAVILRDPRIPHDLPGRARSLLQAFYRQPAEKLMAYERLEYHRQIGVTPPGTETARERDEERALVPPGQEPSPHTGRPDPKWRFSTPVGPAPEQTDYPEFNAKIKIIPDGFPEWNEIICGLSHIMLTSVQTCVEMATIGLGCTDPNTFLRLIDRGPHLFAPTGCDMESHSVPGTVHSSWHTDMSFCTIHGRSNYPGLFIWTRKLKKIPARLPDDGCFLLQVAKQWRICSGDAVHAGFHEVVTTQEASQQAHEEIVRGRKPWRVSLTEFCHVASDQWLKPYDIFDTPEARAKYPPIRAGDRMLQKLRRSGIALPGPVKAVEREAQDATRHVS